MIKPLRKKFWKFLLTLNINLPFEQAIPLLGVLNPRRIKNIIVLRVHTRSFVES